MEQQLYILNTKKNKKNFLIIGLVLLIASLAPLPTFIIHWNDENVDIPNLLWISCLFFIISLSLLTFSLISKSLNHSIVINSKSIIIRIRKKEVVLQNNEIKKFEILPVHRNTYPVKLY